MVSLTHLERGVDCSSTKNYQCGKPLQVRLLIVVQQVATCRGLFVNNSLNTPILALKYGGVVCFCSLFARLKNKNACKLLTYKRF